MVPLIGRYGLIYQPGRVYIALSGGLSGVNSFHSFFARNTGPSSGVSARIIGCQREGESPLVSRLHVLSD